MSIRSRSVKNSKVRGVHHHNTDGFPILSIHSNRRGRFGWVQPLLRSFLIGFECSERKAQFSHLGNTKKSAFSAFFETSAPRPGLAMLQINQEHAKFVFLDGCFNCSSNYAVRGLDQKVYTSVEATANSPPKGQRQHKDPNNYQKRTLFDYF